MNIFRFFRDRKLILSVILIVLFVSSQNIFNFFLNDRINELTEEIFLLQKENTFLREYNDHLRWANALIESIAEGREFTGELNHNETGFAKWYYLG